MKTIDLQVRPVAYDSEDSVRAHVFLCMLAHHVEWQLHKRLEPMRFDDEQLDAVNAGLASPGGQGGTY